MPCVCSNCQNLCECGEVYCVDCLMDVLEDEKYQTEDYEIEENQQGANL